MKHIILIVLLCFGVPLCQRMCIASDKGTDEQQFKVTYTVTYNSITLKRAAELEQLIKQFCKDACGVKVDVDKTDVQYSNAITFGNGEVTLDFPTMTDGAYYGISGGDGATVWYDSNGKEIGRQ